MKSDSIGCVKYIKICQIKASNDSILLSNKFFRTKSRTFQEILKKEYYVYNEEIINGDIVIKEYDCFQKCMLCRLYDKYGKDVLHKIENKSDSLDKINKGYQNPSMVNNQLLIDVFKKEFKYKNLIVTKPEMVFFVKYYINTKGLVNNIKVYKGVLDAYTELQKCKASDPYFEEIRKILCETRWNPAKMYGKPVQSEQELLINANYW